MFNFFRSMKHIVKTAAAVALVALLAGCCRCRAYQKRTRRPLAGTEWQLVQLDGRNLRAAAGEYVVVLDPSGRLSGRGGCNRLSGSWKEGERRALTVGRVASTRMACPDGAREQAFVAALESATHYDMDGPMLLLLSDGELRAVFQALPAGEEKEER